MKKSIVKQAKTKDEAIRLGLEEIGKSRQEVDIEVLEEGSAGFLGIGAKDAVIRLSFDEDINDSLSLFEADIKRTERDDAYNIHDRSEHYKNEAAALYDEENPQVEAYENWDREYDERVAREGDEFEARIGDIKITEDDLGEYDRLQKINSYEDNSRYHNPVDYDLSQDLDKSIEEIENREFHTERREYEDYNEVIEVPAEEEVVVEERTLEERPARSFKAETFTDDEEEVIEDIPASHKQTISSVTFGSDGSVRDNIEKDVEEEAPAESTEAEIDDAFAAGKSSNLVQDKQHSDIDKYYKAKEFLEEILNQMQFEGASVYGNLEGSTITLDAKVDENDTGIAIGKGGQTLDAIELIIRKSIDSRASNLRVNVDINNYKKRRDEKIRELAADTARKVQRSKKSWNLKYMNSYERRLAHEEISKFPNVASHSEGQEPKRYVVVTYTGEEEE